MDRRKYFKRFDAKISEMARARELALAEQGDHARFIERAVFQVLPIAIRYKDDLATRNIEARLSGNADGLTFKLAFPDSTERALTMYPTPDHRIAFVAFTPGDKRRHGSPKDDFSFGPDDWSPSLFEERLQQFIDDFLKIAHQHGGLAGIA